MVGREGQQARQGGRRCGRLHERFGVPRGVGRLGRGEHARAEPPQRRAFGMVVEQATARDDERGRIVVELGQAVGGLRDQEPVVAAVAGDRPESFERLHRGQPTRRRRSCRPGPRDHGALERGRTGRRGRPSSSGRPRTLSRPRAKASWARSVPWCSAHAVRAVGDQHDVGGRRPGVAPVTEAPSGPKRTR